MLKDFLVESISWRRRAHSPNRGRQNSGSRSSGGSGGGCVRWESTLIQIDRCVYDLNLLMRTVCESVLRDHLNSPSGDSLNNIHWSMTVANGDSVWNETAI